MVVGLNSDRSVRPIKGDEKPFYQAAERAQLLAALEMVDYVVVFDDPRAEQIAREVPPQHSGEGGRLVRPADQRL